jgi:hypothetical protein
VKTAVHLQPCTPSLSSVVMCIRPPQRKSAECVVLMNFLYLIKIHPHPSINPTSSVPYSNILLPPIFSPRIKTSRHLEVQNAQRELTKETTGFDQEKKECEGREKSSPYSETFPAGQVYYKISSRHYRHCVKTEKEKEAPGPTSRTLSTRAGSRSGAFGYKQ